MGRSRTILAFATSAVLTPLLVWRCARHPAPVLELSLFRRRSFSTGNLGALLLGTSFFGLVLANSLYLTQVWGYSILRTGLAIAPGPLASAVAAFAAARYTDRVDPRRCSGRPRTPRRRSPAARARSRARSAGSSSPRPA